MLRKYNKATISGWQVCFAVVLLAQADAQLQVLFTFVDLCRGRTRTLQSDSGSKFSTVVFHQMNMQFIVNVGAGYKIYSRQSLMRFCTFLAFALNRTRTEKQGKKPKNAISEPLGFCRLPVLPNANSVFAPDRCCKIGI